jgi:DNA-binding response OmpR family regulator
MLVSTAVPRSESCPSPRVILVVEDESFIRVPLAEYLRDCGYRVFEVASVSEAKSVLNSATPVDLVFTDVNLVGEENGFMLANWVREHHPATKMLITSGVENAAEKAGEQCAASHFVAKPYSYSAVSQRIQALLWLTSTPVPRES